MPNKEALYIAGHEKPFTVGQLREYLNDIAEAWSEEDESHVGSFDNQPIYVATMHGVTNAYIQYHAEFGLVAFPST